MLNEMDDRAWLEPPDYEANAFYKCYYCEGGIYEGDGYYEIENIICCEDCLDDNYKQYAQID